MDASHAMVMRGCACGTLGPSGLEGEEEPLQWAFLHWQCHPGSGGDRPVGLMLEQLLQQGVWVLALF